MRKIKVGAIGCGYWGPNLIRNIIQSSSAEMVAVADIDTTRLDSIRSRFPKISYFTEDYNDLFQLGLDAVMICTPPETHFKITRDCLLNGLHVLVEKPLTTNTVDAQKLIWLADQQGRNRHAQVRRSGCNGNRNHNRFRTAEQPEGAAPASSIVQAYSS